MKKLLSKVLSILTATILLVSALPVAALAEQQGFQLGEGISLTHKVKVTFVDPLASGDPETKEFNSGESLPLNAFPAPAHDGYRLTGWTDEGGNAVTTTVENLQNDLIFTAQFVKVYTVRCEDFDGKLLKEVSVDEGSSFDASSYTTTPTREGFAFTGWSPAAIDAVTKDATVTAQYEQLKSWTVTINYLYESGRVAADPVVSTVYDGYMFKQSFVSPVIQGFVCDKPTVSFDMTVDQNTPDEQKNVTVTYAASGDTKYTVQYRQQNRDDDGYTVFYTDDTRTGKTGWDTAVTEADAAAQLADGYTLVTDMNDVNKQIAADESTMIQIDYNRKVNYVLFDTADGSYVEPIVGRFEQTFDMPTEIPTLVGYEFGGWYLGDVNDEANKYADPTVTIGAESVTLTAKWTAKKVNYTVAVWRENADDTDYSLLGTLKFEGVAGDVASYDTARLDEIDRNADGTKDPVRRETANYFTYSDAVTKANNQAQCGMDAPIVKGDGSTIYNVYYTRNVFTLKFYVGVANNGPDANQRYTLWLRDGTIAITPDGKKAENLKPDGSYCVYTLSAKFEAYLDDKFPGNITWDNQGINTYMGWSKSGGTASTTVTSTRIRMDSNLCNIDASHTQKYKAQFSNSNKIDDLYYLIERLDGDYESAGYDQRVYNGNPGGITGGETNKQMKGFTIVAARTFGIINSNLDYSIYPYEGSKIVPLPEGATALTKNNINQIICKGEWSTTKTNVNASIVWYTRNSHTLLMQNGDNSTSIANVKFDQPLNIYQAQFANPVRPSYLSSEYEFKGWYMDQGYTTLVNWDTLLMPDGDQILYAYWAKPTKTVAFYMEEGLTDELASTKVQLGEKVDSNVIPTPTRDGYRFNYWYYMENGVKKPYIASLAIYQDYRLFGDWTAVSVAYTITYKSNANSGNQKVYDENGDELVTVTLYAQVGDAITVEAPAGYNSASGSKGQALFPDALTKSITLVADATQNTITFYYDRASEVYYKVRYVDQNDVDLLAPEGPFFTPNAIITLQAKSVSGYTPVRYQITTPLAMETTAASVKDNVIVFKYTPNPTGKYIVHYYKQNLDNNAYTEAESKEYTDVALGSVAHAVNIKYEGYDETPAPISTTSGVVYTTTAGGKCLELNVYYNVSYIGYTVSYMEKGTDTKLADDTTGTARYGKTVTVYAQSFPNYSLDTANLKDPAKSSQPIEIKLDASQNTFTFYYNYRTDLSYTVRFLYGTDENAIQIAPSITVDKVRLGKEYSYTQSNLKITDNEIVYHLIDNGGNVPYTQSVTIAEGSSNFIDFHFEPDTFTLTYDANGGSDAPTNTNKYLPEAVVTLAAQGGMAYGQNKFEGWTTDANAIGKVYTTQNELGAISVIDTYTFAKPAHDVTLYAVWSHLTATLTYVSEANLDIGVVPAKMDVTLNNGKATVDVDSGADIGRNGYTFAGWMAKGDNGQYVAPAYGTGEGMTPAIEITGNTTLYATWTPIGYRITYGSNLPAGAVMTNPNTMTSYNIESANITLADASSAGYTFGGWFTDADCTIPASTPAIAKGSTGDRTFYAKFTANVPQSLSVSGYNDVYDGEAHGVTLNDPNHEILDENGAPLLASDTVAYSTANAYTDVTEGETVTVTVKRHGVTIYENSATVVITKRPVNVTTESASFPYDATEHALADQKDPAYTIAAYDATAKTGILPAHEASKSVALVDDRRTDVGSNEIGATVTIGAVTDNYQINVTKGTIAVTDAATTAVATSAAHIYDNTAVGFNTPQMIATFNGQPVADPTVEWKWQTETDYRAEALPTRTDVFGDNVNASGSYVIDVRLSKTNYASVETTATLTISPAPVTVTADSRLDFPYTLNADGSVKEWRIDGYTYQVTAADAGKMVPAENILYNNDTVTAVLNNNTQSAIGHHGMGFESYAITDATHASNYALTTVNGEIGVVRGTADSEIIANGDSFLYDATAHTLYTENNAQTPIVKVATDGGDPVDRTSDFTLSYTVGGVTTTDLPTFTEAGTYTVTISADSTTFANPASVDVSVTVRPAQVSLASGAYSGEYDAANHTVALLDDTKTSGLVNGHYVDTTVLTAVEGSNVLSATNYGDYPVEINPRSIVIRDADGNDVSANYDLANVTITAGGLHITKAPLTVYAESENVAFDNAPHTLNVYATSMQLKGNDVLNDYTLTPADATAVGTHTLALSDVTIDNGSGTDVTGNYDITPVNGTLTIVDFSVTGINETYTGEKYYIDVNVPADIADLYDVNYNGSATNPAFIDAVENGSVTVILTPKTTSSGMPILRHDAPVHIAPKAISLNVNSINKTYDAQPAQLVATLPKGAAVTLSDAAAIMNSIHYSSTDDGSPLASVEFTDVTSLNVTISASHHNYTIEPVETTVSIAARPITVSVTPANQTFIYDELDHTLNVATDYATSDNNRGLLAGHDWTIGTSANLTVNRVTNGWINATVGGVQIYTDDTHTTEVTSNYAISYSNTQVQVVAPDNLTLTLTPVNEVYDGAAHSLATPVVKIGENPIDSDKFNWTYNGEATLSQTNVTAQPLSVHVVGTAKDGYDYPTVDGRTTITITARPITIEVASDRQTYTGDPYSVSAAASAYDAASKTGLLPSDTAAIHLDNEASANVYTQTNAGVYNVNIDTTATDITNANGSVKSNYDITWTNGTLTIDEAEAEANEPTTPYTYDGTAKTFPTPTLTAKATGATLVNPTVEWRNVGEVNWRTTDLPTQTLAKSTLKAGGDASVVADYAATPYTVEVRLTYPNYKQVETTASMTIQRRALTIGTFGNTFPYDALEHSLAESISGNIAADTVTFGYLAGYENAYTNVTTSAGHIVRVDASTVNVTNATLGDVNACYAIGTTEAALVITAQTTTATPAYKTVTYNGGMQYFDYPTMLDANGDPVNEPVTYYYRTTRTGNWVPWTATSSVGAINVSDTTIYVKMTSPNFADVESTSRLEIVQMPVSLRAPSNDSFIYAVDTNGDPIVYTLPNTLIDVDHKLDGLTVSVSALAGASRSDEGNNAVTFNPADVTIMNGTSDVTANYLITALDGSITVSRNTTAETQLVAQPLNETYKGSDYTLAQPKVLVRSADGTAMVDQTAAYNRITYVVTGDAEQTFTNELPHFTNAGTYHIAITATSRLLPDATATVDMVISPYALTLTSGTDDTLIYNGAWQTVDAVLPHTTGMLQGGDSIVADSQTFEDGKDNRQRDVGAHDVLLTSVGIQNVKGENMLGNYTLTFMPGHITVSTLGVSGGLTMNGVSTIYDAQSHGVTLGDTLTTAAGTYSIANDLKDDGTPRFTVSYASKNANGDNLTETSFVNADVYTVTATVTDTTGNMKIDPISATVTIGARPVTIAVINGSIAYDGAVHKLNETAIDPNGLGYTVETATLDANGVPTNQSGLLGTDAASATLTYPDTTADAYRIPATTAYAVNVDRGSGAITSGRAANYTFRYVDGSLAITKATGLSLNVSAVDHLYDGNAYGFTVSTNAPANSALTYEVLEEGVWVPRDLSALPTYTDAEAYAIKLRVSSPYYENVPEGDASFRINARPIIVTSGSNASAPYIYDGSLQSVEAALLANSSANALVNGHSFGTATFADGFSNESRDVCDRDVRLTAVRVMNGTTDDVTKNYAIRYEYGYLKIDKAASAAQNTAISYPYDGDSHGYTLPVLTDASGSELPASEVAYEYSADGVNFTPTAPSAQINVKRDVNGNPTAYVTYVRMSHKNYETKTVTESLTITPAPITVTPDGATYPYAIDADGQAIVRTVDTASTTGTLYKGANVVPTFRDNTRSAMGSQNVYINTVRVWIGTTEVTDNYAITTDTAALAIVRGTDAVSIDAQNGSTVYDANSHAINAPRVLVQAANGAMVDRTADFAVTYDVTYTDRDGNATTTTDLTKLDFVNAGSYAVTVKATSEQYAAPSSVTVTYTINARTLTVTSEDNSAAPYTFNGKEQTVKGDFTVDNLVEKQTLTNLSYADGLSNANTDAVDRGVLLNGLTVMAGRSDVTANYQINYVEGRIVIGALPIPAASIVIDDVNVVYDGEDHSITLPQSIRTSAGTISVADEFDVEYSVHGVTTTTVPTSVDFGSTDVTVHLISRSGNYAPEDVTANVTVTARPLTIAYGTLSVPYDATAHTVDRTVSGLVDRDAITVTDVNRSAIGATRGADGDFGAITATASDYAITDANDAAIDRSANYTVTVTDGSLNVTPIAIGVTAGTNSYVYNGAEQSVTDYTVRGSTVEGQTLEATLGGNTATNVVTRQPVSVTLVTITDANGVDVTDNYRLTAANGSLTITQAPLTLGVTTLSVVYDGAPHTLEGYVVGGLQTGDSLGAYQLNGMPKTEAGAYNRVSYVRSATVLRNKAGADVTANYKITYRTGALTITQPTTTYSVEYYYDGVIGATVTLNGRRGDVVTTYPTRAVDGYTFDRATGAPMTLSETAADNVIRVYYIAVTTPDLVTFTDAEIPLAGNMASLNVGAALE